MQPVSEEALLALFLSHRGSPPPSGEGTPALAGNLAAAYSAAQQAWPGVSVEPAAYMEFLGSFSILPDEQRNVLHLHVVGGLSTPRIAALFKVNQSTVSRWIAAARESIFTQTRTLPGARLGLRAGEFESLVRLLRSQLDLSIGRLLGPSAPEGT